MSMVRVAVFAVIAVAVGGAAYVYRDEVAQRLGWGAAASAAEKGSASPAAIAQPQGRRGRANPGGAVPVVVTTIGKKPMPVVVEAVGTVQAIASIQIKPRIDSQIMKVNVEEGALVKEGDLLFELDNRTLKAQLGMIEAQIRKDQAQIVQAKRDTERADDLLTKGAGTVVQRDTNSTTLKSLEAQLESDEASAPERPDPAQLHRNPRAGVRPHRLDHEQGRHDRPHRRQHRVERARHHQPGRSDLRVLRHPAGVPARSARRDGQGRRSRSTPSSTRPSEQSGTMAFIENTVDPNTGTVTAKARIANANEGLWPGQFVKVEVDSRHRAASHLGHRQPPSSSARRAPTCSSSRTASPKSGPWSSSARRAASRSSAAGWKAVNWW